MTNPNTLHALIACPAYQSARDAVREDLLVVAQSAVTEAIAVDRALWSRGSAAIVDAIGNADAAKISNT